MFDDRQEMGNSLQYLAYLMGGEVGVQLTGDGQEILIPQSDTGQRLACLLGFGRADAVQKEERHTGLSPTTGKLTSSWSNSSTSSSPFATLTPPWFSWRWSWSPMDREASAPAILRQHPNLSCLR